MTIKTTISIVCLALTALVIPGCSLECTAVGCGAENMTWSAELPTILTFEDVRALSVRACRNDVCFERSFAEMAIEPVAPGSGFGMPLSPSGAGVPHVLAEVSARSGGAYDVRVGWTDEVTDGDVYTFEITDADGAVVLERTPTAVSYEVSYPNGPDCDGVCRTASLEGPTP